MSVRGLPAFRGLSCPAESPGTPPTLAALASAKVSEEVDNEVVESCASEEANNDAAVVGAAVAAAERGIRPLLLTKRPGGFLALDVMVLVEGMRWFVIRMEGVL